MSLFAIADLHLSLGTDKPMDIFGGWSDYVTKLETNWQNKVRPEDTVVIPGDISWGMNFEQSKKDFEFINKLNGRKIISKGNHDYWWTTAAKFYKFCEENGFSNQFILNNNCYYYENVAITGTRGWFFEEDAALGSHNDKIFKRELIRLETSLKAAGEAKEIYCFLHYPPRYRGYECPEILALLERYGVKECCYGHLHGSSHRLAIEGEHHGVTYRLCAADYTNFAPIRLR